MITLVSGFWDLHKSKFDTPTYRKWFQHALHIHAPMIFYLAEPNHEMEVEILKCRPQTSPTIFHYRSLEEFQILTQNQVDQYKHRIHPIHCPSIDLGRVWLEKIALVEESAKINPFQTQWFAWYDAGMCTYRETKPPPFAWPQSDLSVLKKECLNFTRSPEWKNDDWSAFPKGMFWHGVTGTWIAHKDTIPSLKLDFIKYWKQLDKDSSTVDPWAFLNDQSVWSQMIVNQPDRFNRIGESYGTYPAILGFTSFQHPTRRISILMPIYHTKPEYVKLALKSIVNQEILNIQMEWVIINDGMDDIHTEYLEQLLQHITQTAPRHLYIRYHKSQKNQGLGASLQKAFQLSSGELLFRMDADDIALPTRFQKQIEYMDTHPDCPALGTQIRLFDLDKPQINSISALPSVIEFKAFRKQNIDWFSAHPTMCYRREVLEKLGGYNIEYAKMIEDYDLHLRILRFYGSLHNYPEVLLDYRHHPDQVTTSSHIKGESPFWVERRKELLQKWIYNKEATL